MPGSMMPSDGDIDVTSMTSSSEGQSPKIPLIPRSEWGSVWPGSKLDWSTPNIPIQLYLELPFWLMMPEGTFDVKYEAACLKISVVHGCEEIHRSVRHSKNGVSTVFIAYPGEEIPIPIRQIIDQSPNGCSVHTHRTTLIIRTTVLRSVLERIAGSDLERAQVVSYLSAMAVGHLPLVNTLIRAYRRAANDPFVQEVTEATAPIWFLRIQDHFVRVLVFFYANIELRPNWPTNQGTQEPADLATGQEVVELLTLPETPGETILLDAWSYFYTGRYSDSIRGLVTAIEVLLEAKYREALKSQANTDEMVQAAMRSTATKFTTRMNEYLCITKRTIPGPLLSFVPYITATRLREELIQTRNLRHKIVHEGHTMSPYSRGPILRAVETMTWLFNWLEDDERNSMNRFKLYGLKTFLRGQLQFQTEYTAEGVRVMEHQVGPPTEDNAEIM